MRLRFYIFFVLFTLTFLSYPGDSFYFHIFAYNRKLYASDSKAINFQVQPIPYLKLPSPPTVTAEGVYIADLDSFTPIYEKNSHEHLYPASTTKIMTALVALDKYKPDDIITVKQATTEGQLMGLFQGERMTVEYLLYGMLVYSGNDAASVFGYDYGYDKFIDAMNQKAQQLGMKDSSFKNPHGLDDPEQYTSAYDLALAARALLQNPLLKKIVSTKEITISDVDYQHFHKLENVNALLGKIQGIGGVKTGYTENAGENLISFYRKKDGHNVLVVILKSQDRFADTESVVKWIEENVEYFSPS